MKKMVSVFFIIVAAAALTACGMFNNPAAPDCVETNVGPACGKGGGSGPGPNVKASVNFGVFIGDCVSNQNTCSGELTPTDDRSFFVPDGYDEVRVIQRGQTYTYRVCVIHPEVPGRRIDLYAGVAGTSVELVFDEGDPSKKSPVCIGRTFVNNYRNGSTNGVIQFTEGRGDLREPNDIVRKFWFKVAPD